MLIKGIPASPGIAIGRPLVFDPSRPKADRREITDPEGEWKRFLQAAATAAGELELVRAKAEKELGTEEGEIFSAHLLMLQDPELNKSIQTEIAGQGVNAEYALMEVAERYAQNLEALEDDYFRARAADIRDVANRVLNILSGKKVEYASLASPVIILARDLTPSDTVMLDKSKLLGFATAEGGATSHTAILARQLGIPAVVGLGPALLSMKVEGEVVLDGEQGELHTDLGVEAVAEYRQKQRAHSAALREAIDQAQGPAVTKDGHRVEVVANIGNPKAAEGSLGFGAEGVGLFRTEFLFLERSQLPSEEEQLAAYSQVAQVFGKQPVILRTLDVGGDKEIPYLDLPKEGNPFLGLRGIRLCLAQPDLFKPQLRAALRAAAFGNLLLMFPMVSTPGEVMAARAILDECRTELEQEGIQAGQPKVGIMVEVPAAALQADKLAPLVDFFSIGTNDLSQYTMAADRTNARVSGIASAFDPAVLNLIGQVIEKAHAASKWVGLCGELGGEPLAIPILLGLGLDEFSMNAPSIPLAKQVIRQCSLAECKAIAGAALAMSTPEEVRDLVRRNFSFV